MPPATHVLLVIVGGIFGTAVRAGLTDAVPDVGGWPVATAFVNLAGAFLLGIGLEGLARRGPDVGRRRVLRLMVGTGFMGSFTTYSTLAMETGELLGGGDIGIGLIYAIGSVLAGIAAAAAGIWAAKEQHRIVQRRQNPPAGPEEPGETL